MMSVLRQLIRLLAVCCLSWVSSSIDKNNSLFAAAFTLPQSSTHRRGTPRPSTSARHVLFNFFTNEEKAENLGTSFIPLDDEHQSSVVSCCDPDFPCVDEPSFDRDLLLMLVVPGLSPFLAYFSFDAIVSGYSYITEVLSGNNWVAVDGKELQGKLLLPTINGLVVPAVALLFATLTSTTISTLRQRQVDVRRAINMEATELRAVECLLDSLEPGFVQDQCRDYLIQYTGRILEECHPRLGPGDDVINPRRGFDSELNGFTRHLNLGHGESIPAHVADECYASVARLREQRTIRITALQSTYPKLHYAILIALALAEMVAFLMETDQEVQLFFNAFQLKVLWSMMLGTFVSCFAVLSDLRSPFSGSYQISESVYQLHTIKMTLQASRVLADKRKAQQPQNAPDHWFEENGASTGTVVNGATKNEPSLVNSTAVN